VVVNREVVNRDRGCRAGGIARCWWDADESAAEVAAEVLLRRHWTV